MNALIYIYLPTYIDTYICIFDFYLTSIIKIKEEEKREKIIRHRIKSLKFNLEKKACSTCVKQKSSIYNIYQVYINKYIYIKIKYTYIYTYVYLMFVSQILSKLFPPS